MNGIMLGLSPREARKRYEAVIDFAELREFQDLKLKNYSSGMRIRLAFSVAIQVDAEILLIDEVLAVGDASFQQKCFDVFNKMRDEGRTIMFVTHDMVTMQRFCHRAMLLERGEHGLHRRPRGGRRPATWSSTSVATRRRDEPLEELDVGDGDARVLDAWVESEHGRAAAARCLSTSASRLRSAYCSWSMSTTRTCRSTSTTSGTRRWSSRPPGSSTSTSATSAPARRS